MPGVSVYKEVSLSSLSEGEGSMLTPKISLEIFAHKYPFVHSFLIYGPQTGTRSTSRYY